MSQHEILEFLKEHKGEKFSTLEIAEATECTRGSMYRKMIKLRKHRLVNHEKVPNRKTIGWREEILHWHKEETHDG